MSIVKQRGTQRTGFQWCTPGRLLLGLIALAIMPGCNHPFQLVHDGKLHPAEFRNGRNRPEGIVPDIRDHVIAVDGQGVPHDPHTPGGQALCIEQFRGQVAHLFRNMRAFHEDKPDRKVLIFVHGGLNNPASSLAAADEQIERVMDAGYYPIFLNWDSDLFSTYGEHATRITQGRTDDGLGRKILSPLYIFADIGRALTRVPIVWSNQVGTDLAAAGADIAALKARESTSSKAIQGSTERWVNTRQGKAIGEVFQKLRDRQDQDSHRLDGSPRSQLRVYIGPDLDVDARHLAQLEVKYILTSPTKFGLSWLIDGLGTPAWENMSRRTLMAFDGQAGGSSGEVDSRADEQLNPSRAMPKELRSDRAVNFKTTGALSIFREELLRVTSLHSSSQPTHPDPNAYHITLVGHSMGTMVLNEWVRRDVLEQRNQLYVNIVYMAAACSVRDFGRSVVPYLLQHSPKPDSHDPSVKMGAQFYNLMLHPLADLRERERAMDLPPRGSLLVWLDDFLADPRTPLDRTLGRWDNIIPATEVIPRGARGQVSLKSFALAPYDDTSRKHGMPYYGPQAHGQFRDAPFWCPEFWYSESENVPDPNAGCKPGG
jgi:hypothetical protein